MFRISACSFGILFLVLIGTVSLRQLPLSLLSADSCCGAQMNPLGFGHVSARAARSSSSENALSFSTTGRVVVAELFTATWCGFCPYATRAINELADEYGSRNLVVLQYHPTSDPFGDSETNARGLGYYGIPGYPTMVFDGTEKIVGGWDGARDSYNATIRSELQETSDVFISIAGSLDDFTANVSSSMISIQPTPAKVRFVVYEDNIPFAAPNGEKILRFVVRTILNDEAVTLIPGQTISIRRAFQPQPEWNITNLGLAVFVQRDDTKQILQAATLNPSPTFSLSSVGASVSVVQPNQTVVFEARLINNGMFDDNYSLTLTKSVPSEWIVEFCLGNACYLDSAVIQLTSGSSQNITVQIITSASEASGNVTLTAVSQRYASQTYSIVFTAQTINQLPVSFPTDLNQDGIVNIVDITIVAAAYQSTPEDSNWNEAADLNKDGTINIVDVTMVAKDYGKTV